MKRQMIPPQAAEIEPDGDEPGDITESPEKAEMSHIKDFVTSLDDTEFGYLQDCIAARVNGEDKPDYKSPDDVKTEMDATDAKRSRTGNLSADEEE